MFVKGKGGMKNNKQNGKLKNKEKDRSKLRCFICKKQGHFKKDWPDIKLKKNGDNDDDYGSVFVAS